MRMKLCPECQADRGIDPQEGIPGRSYFCDPCNESWSDELVARVLATVAARQPGNRSQLEAAVTDALDELAGETADRGERTTLGTPRDVASILTQITTTRATSAAGHLRRAAGT